LPTNGSFFSKTISGRTYWYFREAADNAGKRHDRYVGPDTADLRRRISEHRQAKESYRERRTLVTTLQRAGLPAPTPQTGRVLEALAHAGIFRLRAVVVGTVAYQAYAGLLGVLLGSRNITTGDLDLAQFQSISLAIGDRVQGSLGDILKTADPSFEPVMDTIHPRHATRYAAGDGYRVDILTPNEGADDDSPVTLPAIQAEAQPLRYLDFLIYQEVHAAILFGPGIAINVPAPERFALHKLLVSRLRIQTPESQAKAAKDLRQASELIDALSDQRPYELRDLWQELTARGPKWMRLATEALALLDQTTGSPAVREKFQHAVGIG
jgi:hypothetical protein